MKILRLRTFLRDILGIRALEERVAGIEDMLRVWANRSGEATALDRVVDRLDALIAELPVDDETRQLTRDLRRSATIRGQADDIAALNSRLDQLEERLLESRDETRERSRRRWRQARPDDRLTWMRYLPGDAFIASLERHGAFAAERRILEVGPGYGRLLKALLERDVPFASYLGVDLSRQNIETLRGQFTDPRLTFVQADVEHVEPEQPVDVVYSSLTFKHFYPSFEPALAHLSAHLRPGGRVFFDLVEGKKRYFEPDGVTYLRFYPRDEIAEIVARCGLELTGFDEVEHDEDHRRLLVMAHLPD